MKIETAANPAGEGTPSPESEIVSLPSTPEAQTPAEDVKPTEEAPEESLADLDALAGLDEATSEPEIVEVEVDGKKIKVSADGKEYLLRDADYRRKTMDLAEQRRAFEAKQAEVDQVVNRTQEEFQAAVTVHALNDRIAQIENMDVSGLTQEDINALRIDLNEYTRQRDQLNYALQTHVQQRVQSQSQEAAKLREAAVTAAQKSVPNLTEERRVELVNLAVSLGIPESEASEIYEPAVYTALHYADIGKKFVERQRQAAKAKAAQAGKPAATVGGVAEASKNPEEMTMAEYMAARAAGKI